MKKWRAFLDLGDCRQNGTFVQGIYRNVKVPSWIEAPWKRVKGCCVLDSRAVLLAFRIKRWKYLLDSLAAPWHFKGPEFWKCLFVVVQTVCCSCSDCTFLCPCIICVGGTPWSFSFWIILFLPLWLVRFLASNPTFSAIVFTSELRLLTPIRADLHQDFVFTAFVVWLIANKTVFKSSNRLLEA